jgi:hypothetical protein
MSLTSCGFYSCLCDANNLFEQLNSCLRDRVSLFDGWRDEAFNLGQNRGCSWKKYLLDLNGCRSHSPIVCTRHPIRMQSFKHPIQ